MKWQFLFAGPLVAYILYVSGYRWRARGSLQKAVSLTGREMTWQQALDMVKESPFLGWGFHADRILLESQHIHNSYVHALIHGGIIGTLFFVAAFISVWYYIIKNKILSKLSFAKGADRPVLVESILILGALSSRSFFESTAAFYGVDLLFFISAVAFVLSWHKDTCSEE
jgi:O-antigen ligase